MEFFKNIWAKLVVVLAGAVTILLYILNLKDKKINAYKAKTRLAKTKEEVDSIEYEIKEKLKEREITKKEVDKLKSHLVDLEEKKKKLAKKENSLEELENFFNE